MSWFLIHQESQVVEASARYLLMSPNVLDIWKTDSFIEVATIFLGFYLHVLKSYYPNTTRRTCNVLHKVLKEKKMQLIKLDILF